LVPALDAAPAHGGALDGPQHGTKQDNVHHLVVGKPLRHQPEEQPVAFPFFHQEGQRARVESILERYNQTCEMTPELDRSFAEIAAERIARHPWRYYFTAPLQRALALWFTPRVETLPYSGNLWPPRQRLREDGQDFLVTLSFGGTNLLLLALAGWGLLAWRRQLAFADLLLAWILVRTAFFTTVERPEPRYVLECYTAVFVLAGLGAVAIRRRFFTARAPK
jgi:hypothetical protein